MKKLFGALATILLAFTYPTAAATLHATANQTTAAVKSQLSVTTASSTCTVPSGASESTIQAALNSCGSGNTVAFGAGTFGPLTSTITIPCGVSLAGPAVLYSQMPNQTATINGSSSFIGWGFQTTAGCSVSQTIQYLAWNGGLPANGGGFLNIVPGTTNLTVRNNWLHGVNAPGASTGSQYNQADLIYFNGSASSSTTSNVLIQWNVFGSTSFADCATAMNDTSSDEDNGGGGCGGIGIHNNVTNVTITNNILHWLEEPIKTFESPSSGSCNNVVIDYNSVTNYSRIGYETQCYTPGPTLMYVQYNNWGTRYNKLQSYDISAANGCGSGYGSTCETHVDYNVDLQATTGAADVGIEMWGQGAQGCTAHCTTANYNLLQGYLYNGITWSVAGNFQFNNNTFNLVNNGTNQNCVTGNSGFWNKESGNNPAFNPTCTGNTFSNAITGTTPSIAPTVSPATGTFSGSQVVTITNPGANRDTNTTDWCTTDGSTPTPGSGTAVGYYNGGTLTVTSTTTVKCVGMWGALNQPYSYPSGYAYVPSAVVSSVYTGSGSTTPPPPLVTTSTPTSAYLGAPNNQNTVIVGGTIQFTAYGMYPGNPDGTAIPNAQVTWSTDNPKVLTVNPAGMMTAVGAGSAGVHAMIGTLNSSEWIVTVATPVITSAYLTAPSSQITMTKGGTLQLTAYGTYTGSTTPVVIPTTQATLSSANPAVLTVSPAGLVTAVGQGTANVQVSIGTFVGTAYGITVSNPVPTELYLGAPNNQNTMVVGGTPIQFTAYGVFPGSTVATAVPASQVTWTTSDSTILQVSSTGSVTAVGVGKASVQETVGSFKGSPWTVVVSAPPPVTQTLAPGVYTITIAPGGSATLTSTLGTVASQ